MTASKETLRLAMVGCGNMGQAVHLPNFLRVPRCSVVAICDRDADLAARVARAYHVPHSFGDIEQMLDSVEVDAVAAIVHWTLNPEVAAPILRVGKHLFIEKPMCNSSAGAAAMAQAAREAGVKLMVAYMKRYDPGVQRAKRLLDDWRESGELGKITRARVHDYMGDWTHGFDRSHLIKSENPLPRPPIDEGVPDFVRDEDKPSYAGWQGNFCHDINLMRYLVGEPVRVMQHQQRPAKGGARTVSVLDYGEFDCVFETDYVPTTIFDEGVRVNFEKGWLEVSLPAPLWVNTPAEVRYCVEGEVHTAPREWGWSFMNEAKHFVDCVLEDKEPLSSGDDGAKDIAIAEEMYKAYVARA